MKLSSISEVMIEIQERIEKAKSAWDDAYGRDYESSLSYYSGRITALKDVKAMLQVLKDKELPDDC